MHFVTPFSGILPRKIDLNKIESEIRQNYLKLLVASGNITIRLLPI